jgi:hypothetical protein
MVLCSTDDKTELHPKPGAQSVHWHVVPLMPLADL